MRSGVRGQDMGRGGHSAGTERHPKKRGLKDSTCPDEWFLIPRNINFPEVAVAFPASYGAGASSLGFSLLYEAFSRVARTRRYFLENGTFRSPDTFDPIGRNRIIAFSIAFEPDIPAIADALSRAGISRFTRERGPLDPYMAAGGVGVTLAPVLASTVFDAVFTGEGDFRLHESMTAMEMIAEILAGSIMAGGRHGREDLPHRLFFSLAAVCPCHEICADEMRTGSGGVAFRLPGDNLTLPAASAFISPEAEFSSTGLIEIARGCPGGCRFCFACHGYKPFRVIPTTEILKMIEERFASKGVKSAGLVGAAACRHPDIEIIADFVRSRGMRPTLSSVSVDLMESLAKTALNGQKSVAVALETACGALQKEINKTWDLSVASRGAACLGATGVKELKLYVMVGIPGEKNLEACAPGGIPRHLNETIEACLAMSRRFREAGGSRVRVSVNPFVPKPGTPMANEPMMSRRDYKAVGTVFRERLRSQGCDVIFENIDSAYLQLAATVCGDPEGFIENPPGKKELERLAVTRNFTNSS